MLIALCGVFVSGCGTWMFPSELRLDAGVTRELRGAGKILEEVDWTDTWSDVDIFGKIFMVDGGESDVVAAVADVADRLKELEWQIIGHPDGEFEMTSGRWKDVIVIVTSYDAFIFDDAENAYAGLALANAAKRSESRSLVIVAARPDDR
ncbi:hypothetical protein [Nonomuraea sp. ZG12]|uniref:hypothetical protein n=1 Tax=Nonomuraea sp. ZG12 TaxID=3452207 RepID=UPI003F8A5C90